MCSFATGAASRVITSAIGCARVRGVTLEKKLIFCSCTVFVFIHLVYKILPVVSLNSVVRLTAQVFMRRSCLNGPHLQSRHQRRQGANILRDPARAACDRNGNARVEAVIGGGGILANIENRLASQSPIYMSSMRNPSDQTGLASVKGNNDLTRNALCTFDFSKGLGNLTQPRNV